MATTPEVFRKLDDDDYSIVEGICIDPALAETSLSDLAASTANLVREFGLGSDPHSFQMLYNLLSSGINAFRSGATKEHLVKSLQDGYKRGKTS